MVTSDCKGSVAEVRVEIEERFANRQKPMSLRSRKDTEKICWTMEGPHEAAVEVEGWLVRWKPHFEISVNFRLCGSIAPLKREETTTDRVTSRRIVKVNVSSGKGGGSSWRV
jgi:hypothetical protein